MEAVTAIVDYLVKEKDQIDISGLFIATNGKEYRQELVDAVKTILFYKWKKNLVWIKNIQYRSEADQIYVGRLSI